MVSEMVEMVSEMVEMVSISASMDIERVSQQLRVQALGSLEP